MAATEPKFKKIIWEIEGYVREMGQILSPKVIPCEVNGIITQFYDPVRV